MKYGRVMDLRQASFSGLPLSELRLRSSALLPQRPPLFAFVFKAKFYFARNIGMITDEVLLSPVLDRLSFVCEGGGG